MTQNKANSKKRKRSLPGDEKGRTLIEKTIRVNHAGEYGAQQIYRGQIAVLGKTEVGPLLQHMAEQEEEHLDYFDKELTKRRIRPTALHPIWTVAGYALGAGTALLGKEAAMACTEAVEEVIIDHYQDQLDRLPDEEKDLKKAIQKFKDEEDEHRQIGVDHDAHLSPAYKLLTKAIKTGSKIAIKLSERI
ncbi:MAG: demethoxyubiquinone hydroxylase family protein [Rickettsiales bacterium]|nr:demethoxyubiquinone hydroxylase family protein [Rickettsiales bacterium]|tara:strand:+ start:1674 stop:2243 length:570 start_codon:yes stop_codon:yes gene_type:complete